MTLSFLNPKFLFFAHGLTTIFLIAALFTLIGYLIGTRLWGRRKDQADRMVALNKTLKRKKETLASDQEKLSELLKDFS